MRRRGADPDKALVIRPPQPSWIAGGVPEAIRQAKALADSGMPVVTVVARASEGAEPSVVGQFRNGEWVPARASLSLISGTQPQQDRNAGNATAGAAR